MKYQIKLSVIFFLLILTLAACSANLGKIPQKTDTSNGLVLYVGDGCPHCKIVEDYLTKNNIESKVSFTKKEIFHDQANASEMVEKAKSCGLSQEGLGVPFLVANGKCYEGDQDVINYFNNLTASK